MGPPQKAQRAKFVCKCREAWSCFSRRSGRAPLRYSSKTTPP
jgi:hypothetical protein